MWHQFTYIRSLTCVSLRLSLLSSFYHQLITRHGHTHLLCDLLGPTELNVWASFLFSDGISASRKEVFPIISCPIFSCVTSVKIYIKLLNSNNWELGHQLSTHQGADKLRTKRSQGRYFGASVIPALVLLLWFWCFGALVQQFCCTSTFLPLPSH